jgi:hypothetical protein
MLVPAGDQDRAPGSSRTGVLFTARFQEAIRYWTARFFFRFHVHVSMDLPSTKRWTIFLLGILSAILIASEVTHAVVRLSGLTGWIAFIGNFFLYAAIFFSLIALYEKIFHVEFFRFHFD